MQDKTKLTLKQWMGLKDVSGKELAYKTGLTEQTISHLRRRRNKPNISTLKILAEALEIGIEDIEV